MLNASKYQKPIIGNSNLIWYYEVTYFQTRQVHHSFIISFHWVGGSKQVSYTGYQRSKQPWLFVRLSNSKKNDRGKRTIETFCITFFSFFFFSFFWITFFFCSFSQTHAFFRAFSWASLMRSGHYLPKPETRSSLEEYYQVIPAKVVLFRAAF